mgnify:CR=1 FL=1
MFNRWLLRLFVGLCFALPMGILAVVTVEAQTVDEEEPSGSECEGCHEITQAHWSESAHASSVEDPIFQEAWLKQGSPKECLACHTTGYDPASGLWETESVSCSTCHGPDPGDHPEKIMPTDISSRMCGSCHLDTHTEWEDSVHGQEDLACVRCHSPHTTELRADGVQELCKSCHNDVTHFYGETKHAEEGLLCSDCHLRVSDAAEGAMGDGHGQRVHTFAVDLESCSKCHEEEMHYPSTGAMTPEDNSILETGPALSLAAAVPLNNEPDPVSPFGFAVLATLVGMGFGIVVAPWLEKWNRRMKNEGNQDE